MPREKKIIQEDPPPGAPIWMLTYSDCVTLLLTFFVLLMSFSSFDERVFYKLKIIYADAFPTIQRQNTSSRDSMSNIEMLNNIDKIDNGSNAPTTDEVKSGNLKESLYAFENQKVFLINSNKIFWGNGTTVSTDGEKVLATLADFLRTVQGQVLINEICGPSKSQASSSATVNKYKQKQSIERVRQVAHFFTTKQNMAKERFNISSGSTVGDYAFDVLRLDESPDGDSKVLEIVLIDKSIYQ